MQENTKRERVPIPKYSLGEELISSISHGAGALLGVAALVLCVVRAVRHGSAYAVVGGAVFGAALILLYATSTIYHALRPSLGKKVFRVLDHCMIYLLIAGSYTPITLVTLRPTVGWWLFGAVWIAAAVAIVFNAIDIEKFSVLSMICYLAMGWAIVVTFKPLVAAMAREGIWLLVAGGIAYTLGAVVYGVGGKVKYMHSLWHFFVLAGSVFHFFCIYLYVI